MIEQLHYPGDLSDAGRLAGCLAGAGLDAEAARAKAEMFAKAATALRASETAAGPLRAFFVPGRIEVFGKHTDYAGGATVVAAAQRGFCLVAAPRADARVTVRDVRCGEQAEFTVDAELAPAGGHWSNYPMTVARRVARNFPGPLLGADVTLASDLPPAAGMSSSSAMIVATFLVLAEVNDLDGRPEFLENVHDAVELAGYLATIENGQTFGSLAGDRGVGTFGGSEDHTAILNCRAGQLSEFSYCPVRFIRTIPLPERYTFAIGACGVAAEKTGAAMEKYNRASGLASEVAELWRKATGRDDPHLAAALASGPEAAGRLLEAVQSAGLDETRTEALLARLEHFVVENEQLRPQGGDAITRGDMAALGPLADQSQKASEELLRNQVPETVRLAALARQCGAAAASAFGAGFGGSVWALVERSRTGPFLAAWSEAYAAEFPQNTTASSFFLTGAGPAAMQVC